MPLWNGHPGGVLFHPVIYLFTAMTDQIEVSGRALIFDKNGNALILKRHPASTTNPGKWELPGGKPDKGESFEASSGGRCVRKPGSK